MSNGMNIDGEGLRKTAENYMDLASRLNIGIDTFGQAVSELASKGIYGTDAPQKLNALWFAGEGPNDGLEATMRSYVTELNNSAAKIENYVTNLSGFETAKSEQLGERITIVK